MEKTKNINFLGVKNIGACSITQQIKNTEYARVRKYLIVQLTDDFNGKDLTEFNQIIKNSNSDGWFRNFPEDKRFIHLITEYICDLSKEIENPIPKLILNFKEVPVNKDTLKLFSFIAKLTRKISNMDTSEIVHNKDFKYGIAGRTFLIPNCDMAQIAQNSQMHFKKFMDQMPYSPMSVINGAKAINENIHKQMIDYLK